MSCLLVCLFQDFFTLGQYDFGPIGCQLMDRIISEWQKHFIVHDRMLKVNSSILTPENVLKASGHTDRFSDAVVKVNLCL